MNIENLCIEIRNKQMRQPVSFVVMNKFTHDLLVKELRIIYSREIDKLTVYQGLDILISEDVNNNEFRIG